MRLVGRALADHDVNCVCVGVATWGCVHGREQLQQYGGEVEVTTRRFNSVHGANLEPNHTHFLLCDSGQVGRAAWGGEIDLRTALETAYSSHRKVPRVLVAVQGGPNSLKTLKAALVSGCPVVLVADSGGMATVLDHFLRTYYDESSPLHEIGEIIDVDGFDKVLTAAAPSVAVAVDVTAFR